MSMTSGGHLDITKRRGEKPGKTTQSVSHTLFRNIDKVGVIRH